MADSATRRGVPTASADGRKEGRKAALAVFVIAALVFAVSPVITNYDSYPAFPTAVSLVNRHTLSLDAYRHVKVVASNYGVGTVNHHLLTSYPWTVALFAVPAVLLLDIVHVFGGPSADAAVAMHPQIGSLVQLWSASIVTALACALLALLAYRRLTGDPKNRRRWALVCGLAFAFGTSAWSTASRSLWQHGPALLFLALGLLALDRFFPIAGTEPSGSPRWALVAGACFMAAVTVRPTNAIVLALAGLVILWKARRQTVAFIGGALLVAIPWVAVTQANYGTLLQAYDKSNKLGLVSTFFESVAANLVSPGRGLLIFSPIALVCGAGLLIAWRRRAIGPLESMSSVAVVCYVVTIGLFPIWWAGNSYGPRFLSEALPFLFLLALPFVDWLRTWSPGPGRYRSHRFHSAVVGAVVVLLAVSLVINGEGGVLRASTCWNGKAHTAQNIDNDPSRVWSWSNPQFDYGLRALGTEGLHAITRCPANA